MKNISKNITSLLLFFIMQVFLIGLVFLQFKIEFFRQYRESIEYNFQKIAALVENNLDDIEDLNLEDLYTYTFTNIIIAESDGNIIKLVKPSNIFKLNSFFKIDDINFEMLFSKDSYFDELVIENQTSLLLSKRIGDFVLIAYESTHFQNVCAAQLILKYLIIVLCQTVVMSIFLIFHLKASSGELTKYRPDNLQFFSFNLRKNGDVIKSKNNVFAKKFEIENIIPHLVDSNITLAKALSEQRPFGVCIADSQNSEYYFHCIATKTANGYRVLAVNGTSEYFANKKITEQVLLEQITSLRNKSGLELDFSQLKLVKSTRQKTMAIFTFKNLKNIEVLFSVSIKNQVLKKVAKMFKEKLTAKKFGIYFIDNEKIVVLAQNEEQSEYLKSRMPELINAITSIMAVDKANVQLVSEVVLLYLSSLTHDDMLDEVLEYSDYLVMNTKKRIDANFISEIFTKSKYYHAIGNKKEITKRIIEENRFHLFFQPQYRIVDKKLVAFEALVRVDEISLSTQDFILISEVNGYMLKLGDAITHKALEFAKMINHTGIAISINLSVIQLLHKGFVESFLKKYKEFELRDGSIALEITETFLMSDVSENMKKLQILHENGILIHLDDFGMGYSSLAYLKNLPVDVIKIDREFVANIDTDSYSEAICRFVISTAKELKIETIAEGIEKKSQLDALGRLGCDMVQGFYSGKPMNINDTLKLIESKIN